MTEAVLDASAMIAYLKRENGADAVFPVLPGALLLAVNLSEILQKMKQDKNRPLDASMAQIRRLRTIIVPFDNVLAEATAALWPLTKPLGLSLADRACLALGQTRNLPVYTADHKWREIDLGIQIVVIR